MHELNYKRKPLSFEEGWVADWTDSTVVVRYHGFNGIPYEPVIITVRQPNPADIEWFGEAPEKVYDLVHVIVTDDAAEHAEWSLVHDLVMEIAGAQLDSRLLYPVSALPKLVSVFNALGRLDWLRFEYVAVTDSRLYQRRVKELAAKRAGA